MSPLFRDPRESVLIGLFQERIKRPSSSRLPVHQGASTDEYRQSLRQTLPIDEELSPCDKRSREIVRLCGLRLRSISSQARS
jgi:hypothetical protein